MGSPNHVNRYPPKGITADMFPATGVDNRNVVPLKDGDGTGQRVDVAARSYCVLLKVIRAENRPCYGAASA